VDREGETREPDEDARRQALISFMTTEHFTLQGARTSAVAETNSRLQTFMTFVSMSVLALALVAQISRLGDAFFTFAFLLLPVVYVLGLATIGRFRQLWQEWFHAGQAMNRIRRYFVDVAPEAKRYLTLPTTDEPWTTLSAWGIRAGGRLGGLVTVFAVLAMINSVVASVLAGLVAIRLTDRGSLATAVGAAAFVLSFLLLMSAGRKDFFRNMAQAETRFPPEETSS
jgi:hypothetical protein